ncbi:inner membrane-spanning protein YciB [Puniceibacterium sediminis]|uniref:Inner membrane-spanning protein YciB n=1 Tax=Puniceibacterium sediminis TaxID=1608407 RepID=A0A238UWZ4_9RHOB|nr:inner membrane-spanning protein YciB [Puniceibacterium sediminis]SNR26257.1 intracellular septation protein [Puniceibacterium sediminis]
MAERKIHPMLKTTLELGPVVLFFAAYVWLKDETFNIAGTDYKGFIIVTAGFIPLIIASTAVLWALTGKLSRMQIVTVVLITVFGGLSVWLNDDRFFKMKPTLIYLLFGGVLAFGLLKGESYLKYVMEGLMPLEQEGWMLLTKRVCALFLALALANEVIWRTMSTETWVYFKTFGLTAAIFGFFFTQGGLFKRYAVENADEV